MGNNAISSIIEECGTMWSQCSQGCRCQRWLFVSVGSCRLSQAVVFDTRLIRLIRGRDHYSERGTPAPANARLMHFANLLYPSVEGCSKSDINFQSMRPR